MSTRREFLEGVIVGYEVGILLGQLVNPKHRNKGFHTTGTIGTFIAGVVASKLLKLDDGRVVPQIIADYQDSNNKGTVMYLQIDEKAGTLTGISYSPITKSYDGYKDIDTDQFQIKLPW